MWAKRAEKSREGTICYNLMRAKPAWKILKLNRRERSERKILHFSPNSSKLRSDYLFSFQKKTNYLFPSFSRSEYLFPKSASPPPHLRIKWSSPKYNVKIVRFCFTALYWNKSRRNTASPSENHCPRQWFPPPEPIQEQYTQYIGGYLHRPGYHEVDVGIAAEVVGTQR